MTTQQIRCREAGPKSSQRANQVEVEPGQHGLKTDLPATQLQCCLAVRALAEKELLREGGTDPRFYLSPQWLLAVGLRKLSS